MECHNYCSLFRTVRSKTCPWSVLVYYSVQWNTSIAATLGEQHSGRYIGVAFIEGLFSQTVHLGPGCLAVVLYCIVGFCSGVAVKRGSTVVSSALER